MPHLSSVRVAAALWIAGCGTAGAPRGAEPAVGAGPFPSGPAPPTQALALPSLDVDWTPARRAAGDLTDVADTLSDLGAAQLVAPADWLASPVGGESAASALQSLAPQTRWLPSRAAAMGTALTAGALPVLPELSGSDAPRFDAEGVRLDAAWLAPTPADAEAVVLLDAAPVSAAAWALAPELQIGGCDDVFASLAAGQEHGLADVEPFIAHLEELLLQVYRPGVAALAPRWLEELAPYVDASPLPDVEPEQHACGQAYLRHVRAVAACARATSPDCTIAPKVVLDGGLRIGLPLLDERPAEAGCGRLVGRDYVEATRALAAEAAIAVEAALDPSWLQLADRVGALTEVHASVVQMCAPSRRRFAAADLDEARRRLATIGEVLAGPFAATTVGRFRAVDGMLPGKAGVAMAAVAELSSGPAGAAAEAVAEVRSLHRWLQTRERCRGDATALPWAVVIADPDDGVAHSLSYVYPESLVCDELGPHLP
ncbi:MAG: hypothetical protein AAF721_11055 [Myxococcota bacterium]